MATVKQLLQNKGPDIWSIGPDARVYEALELMAEKEIGALLVLEGDALVGIISERDYARKVALRGRTSLKTPVKEIMTRKVYHISPEQTVEACMGLMTNRHIRHVPVLSGNSLVGIVSIGDIVKAIISNQEFMIEQLENYIVTSSS